MALTASLPMYDLPEIRPSAEAVWQSISASLIRSGLADVPDSLTWDAPDILWRDPGLLLSQCCGYPLTQGFAAFLRPVATPCYAAEGCDGASYRSAVVVHRDAPMRSLEACKGLICAVNGWDSLSGWQALAAMVLPLAQDRRFFGAATVSGSHLASVEAVADGHADLAAIDAVSWALYRRHRPELTDRLTVIDWTEPAPGLPLVTAAGADHVRIGLLRAAFDNMLADPGLQGHRGQLLLTGVEPLTLNDYACVSELAERAAGLERPPPASEPNPIKR